MGFQTILVALLIMLAAPSAEAGTSIVDIGPSFPMGPYTSLHVDKRDPDRLALATMDGRIAWSESGATYVRETRVFSPRRYDAMAIRGNAHNANLGSQDPGQDESDNQGPGAGRNPHRPVRLFIKTLTNGKGIVRWQYWRAIADPLTEIGSIVLPAPGGRMLAATPAGIMVSDGKGSSWTKTLGAPGTMPREEKDLVGLSVMANPYDPSFVLAGTTEGVFLSRDGGMNFVPHTDPNLAEEMIFDFLWDEVEPEVVLALGPDTILQSEDGGMHFELAYVSPAEINTVVVSELGVFVATVEGLTLVGGENPTEVFQGESVLGVVPWTDGGIIFLTPTKLLRMYPSGEQELLMRTNDVDPFLKLDGAAGTAYMLSSSGIFRIGSEEERKEARTIPVLTMSASATQQAMLDHLGLGDPEDTRLHSRWYAKLLPRLTFNATSRLGSTTNRMVDYTLPLDYRYLRNGTESNFEFSIMANWNLTEFFFGDHNVSNPELFIESTLVGNRDRLLMEVRNRYREAQVLAHRLKSPPANPETEFFWKMRLEEHTSYLEYLTGKPVVRQQTLEQ